jgi:hypothetical protein
MSFSPLDTYERIPKRCKRCRWRLFEAGNRVRFCMYCDWHENDEDRLVRLTRAPL